MIESILLKIKEDVYISLIFGCLFIVAFGLLLLVKIIFPEYVAKWSKNKIFDRQLAILPSAILSSFFMIIFFHEYYVLIVTIFIIIVLLYEIKKLKEKIIFIKKTFAVIGYALIVSVFFSAYQINIDIKSKKDELIKIHKQIVKEGYIKDSEVENFNSYINNLNKNIYKQYDIHLIILLIFLIISIIVILYSENNRKDDYLCEKCNDDEPVYCKNCYESNKKSE